MAKRVFDDDGLPCRKSLRLLVANFLLICEKYDFEPAFIAFNGGSGRAILKAYFLDEQGILTICQKWGWNKLAIESFLRVVVGEIVRLNSVRFFAQLPLPADARNFFLSNDYLTALSFLIGLRTGSLQKILITEQRKAWARVVLIYIDLLWGQRLELHDLLD